ncbi:MAG: hypothetical protein ACE5EF_07950 [Dehalococcoidia bacterium]
MTESRFGPELRAECGEWIWEQLQEEGVYIAGELIDLIIETERELAIQTRPIEELAQLIVDEFQMRGVTGNPGQLDTSLVRSVLEWEDEFLGFAGIRREDS